MQESHFFQKEDLISILNDIIDKTLGEVDKNHVFAKTITNPKVTGIAGDVIEQSVLGYPADQEQRPDLDVDGILTELKTTGMRLITSTASRPLYEAKEPASITAVSIPTIARETFYDSKFWHKAEHLLFIFYQYESPTAVIAAKYADFHIRGYRFHEFSEDDIEILKRDWQTIHDFIADIQAHYSGDEASNKYPQLSTLINRQTIYLDTAPKYPHSPRFRLRRRVISNIIHQTFNGQSFEKLPDKYFSYSDVERKCAEITKQFKGYSMAEILKHFGVTISDEKQAKLKQYAEQVIVWMFGGKSKKISKIEMFSKFGYIPKSITVTTNDSRTEDMKLFSVDFDELSEPIVEDEFEGTREKTFEDSELYSYFCDNKILCVVFQENNPDKGGNVRLSDNKFLGFKILDLSDALFLQEARQTWEDARDIICNDKLVFEPVLDKNGAQRYTPKTGIPMGAPNLPKSKDHIVFLRGGGIDATDKIMVKGVPMLRQSYWVKGSYIVDRLKAIPYI